MASLFRRRTPPRPDVEQRTADLSQFLGPLSPWAQYSPAPMQWFGASAPTEAIESVIAVYACVSLLADLAGSLPLHLYRKNADDPALARERVEPTTRDRALRGVGYPGTLQRLIGSQPNSEMTAQELWTQAVGYCALWGNAYIEIIRDGSGRPSELWPLRPDRMRVTRDADGDLVYTYMLKQKAVEIPEVMHLRLFGTDGILGLSPIQTASKTLSADRGAQNFADRWYANSASPSGIVSIPKGPQDKFKDRVRAYRKALSGLYGGTSNAGKIAVIEEGTSWQTVSISQADMQFIEARKFTVTEIARLYRVPPHLIQDVERSTSWGTGIEQANMAFLAYTLRPILARLEGGINRDLGLVPGQRTLEDEGLYPEFLTADLLRADLKSRFDAYAVGVQWGILTRNEPRGFENLQPLPGLDEPLTPVNMVAGEPPTVANQPSAQPAPAMAAASARADELHAATLAALAREPQQLQPPNIETPVTVYRDIDPELLRQVFEAIPPPQITINTAPLARMLGEVEAHRSLEASNAEERAAERHAELVAKISEPPKPLRRVIVRDKHSNMTEVRDVPFDEETA